MTTKTYLCYDIPVTNESLTYASMAYPELKGPFRFIRLVQWRTGEGTLQTEQSSTVGSIPIELWDLVRHKVTDVELDAAERKFLERHACSHCVKPHGCGCCGAVPATEGANLLLCDSCKENMIRYDDFGDFKTGQEVPHPPAGLRPRYAFNQDAQMLRIG
ncbi:hypothetical protein RHOSPDRAFT_33741 [Rhodotorula sp. JG-1b]|nr:hypothetical protein RHOSPDRAFT_33741 [Rhodotorula sp. JG-1b]